MANTNYTDFTGPVVNAEWLNDTNRFIYLLAGDGVNAPLNDSDVKTNLGITADIAAGDAATLASATALPGRLIGVQVFTAGGTYTPTAGTTSIILQMQGAGGAGGGAAATGAGQTSNGAGGGAGGYAEHRLTTGFSGASVVIGSGGTPAVGLAGGAGGTTSFGAFVSIPGGAGGLVGVTAAVVVSNGGTGSTPSAGNITLIPGQAGNAGISANVVGAAITASGGFSIKGNGGPSRGLGIAGGTAGADGTGFGSGGGGATNGNSQPAIAGGAGRPGMVIVYEYS